MPYTATGKWFPPEWFVEMGVQPVHDDPSEESVLESIAEYNLAMRLREEALQRMRLEAEIMAEQARLAAIAARPPLYTRILEAFADTLFTAIAIPVYRRRTPPMLRPIVQEIVYSDGTDAVLPELPTETIEYEIVEGYKQIVNSRTDDVISIMSSEYEIINDVDVLQRAATLFEEANIEVIPEFHHVTVGKNGIRGRTTLSEFRLPDMSILPDSPAAHDVRIVVTNSFDGTKKERLLLVMRNADENYTYSFTQNETMAIRHRTGANARLATAFSENLQQAIAYNTRCIEFLRTHQAPNQDVVMEYIQGNSLLSGERNVEKLTGRWMVQDCSTNMWDIYRLFADCISQDYGRNFSAKITRLKMLNDHVHRLWPQLFECGALP